MENKTLKGLAIIFLLFWVSVGVRYSHLDRPLGIHNENASAHVLVTLKSYDRNPISEHYFLPIYNYNNPNDKYINNMPPSSIMTKDGNYIYTSFPV